MLNTDITMVNYTLYQLASAYSKHFGTAEVEFLHFLPSERQY